MSGGVAVGCRGSAVEREDRWPACPRAPPWLPRDCLTREDTKPSAGGFETRLPEGLSREDHAFRPEDPFEVVHEPVRDRDSELVPGLNLHGAEVRRRELDD